MKFDPSFMLDQKALQDHRRARPAPVSLALPSVHASARHEVDACSNVASRIARPWSRLERRCRRRHGRTLRRRSRRATGAPPRAAQYFAGVDRKPYADQARRRSRALSGRISTRGLGAGGVLITRHVWCGLNDVRHDSDSCQILRCSEMSRCANNRSDWPKGFDNPSGHFFRSTTFNGTIPVMIVKDQPDIPFVASCAHPPRADNAVQPLVGGVVAYCRIATAVQAAKHSIWLTFTFFAPDFHMRDAG